MTDFLSASLHMRFGAGFFETLLYHGGSILHLDLHIERIQKSLEHFEIPYQSIDFEAAIRKHLRKSDLLNNTAKVNIFYPIHNWDIPSEPIILVAPFPHTPEAQKLFIYPKAHTSFLGGYKSMSYSPYLLAKRAAEKQGFHDSILISPEGSIQETATSSLLFFKDDHFYTPKSNYILPSITLNLVRQKLEIREVEIPQNTLKDFEHVYTLNSLRGIEPVSQINDIHYKEDWQVCSPAL